ncbi:hypothetical protein HK405_002629 [Cladochytrium tenue]|nr:hypothetical protein HK405_002629 [Cladochytrium tenue]
MKVLYDSMFEGELEWQFDDIPNPCWRLGQWYDGYFGHNDGPGQAMLAADEELDDVKFAVAVGETPMEDDRITHFSPSELDEFVKEKGGNITGEHICSFMDDDEADDVELEDLYVCGGLWTLVALRKYCTRLRGPSSVYY